MTVDNAHSIQCWFTTKQKTPSVAHLPGDSPAFRVGKMDEEVFWEASEEFPTSPFETGEELLPFLHEHA